MTMLGMLTHATIWVHDQDAALDFYTKKLGMEVRADVTIAEMGNYRWLTVGATSQPDVSFILTVPGPPVIDGDMAKQLRDFIAQGVIGSYHFATDDCEATYRELKDRGVEFIMEPTEMPYGIDAQFHDPSGNKLRFTQSK
jgi:predicted enzyme related to lactoylglutathione lyase